MGPDSVAPLNPALEAVCRTLGIDPERTSSLRVEVEQGGERPRLVAYWEGSLHLTEEQADAVLWALSP